MPVVFIRNIGRVNFPDELSAEEIEQQAKSLHLQTVTVHKPQLPPMPGMQPAHQQPASSSNRLQNLFAAAASANPLSVTTAALQRIIGRKPQPQPGQVRYEATGIRAGRQDYGTMLAADRAQRAMLTEPFMQAVNFAMPASTGYPADRRGVSK